MEQRVMSYWYCPQPRRGATVRNPTWSEGGGEADDWTQGGVTICHPCQERAKALYVLLASTLLPLAGRPSTTWNNPGCRYALPWAVCRLPFQGVATDYCTSNCTPYLLRLEWHIQFVRNMEWYHIHYYYWRGSDISVIAYAYVCNPDKVNNLKAERLITLRPKGY